MLSVVVICLIIQSISLLISVQKSHCVPPPQNKLVIRFCSRRNAFNVSVYLDALDSHDGKAAGDLFWDDGESIGEMKKIKMPRRSD